MRQNAEPLLLLTFMACVLGGILWMASMADRAREAECSTLSGAYTAGRSSLCISPDGRVLRAW